MPGRQRQIPSPQRLDDAIDLLAAAVAAGLSAVAAVGHAGLPRTLLALGFAGFVPGRAIVTNWPRLGAWSQAAIAMVLSIAIVTLVAMIALWAHAWHPLLLFQFEAGLSLAGLAAGVLRRRRHSPATAAVPRPGGSG